MASTITAAESIALRIAINREVEAVQNCMAADRVLSDYRKLLEVATEQADQGSDKIAVLTTV